MNFKRAGITTLTCAALVASLSGVSPANADLSKTCKNTGYLCVADLKKGDERRFEGPDRNWHRYGWGDRADKFYNGGKKCTATIHEHVNGKGGKKYLGRGVTKHWFNIVSSNYWTDC